MLIPYMGNLILIVRQHKDGRISVEPPGGKRDIKFSGGIEAPEEALIREAREELGIGILPLDRLGVENHPFTGKPVGYYYCECVDGVPYNVETKQHLQVIGVTPSQRGIDEFRRVCALRNVGGMPVDFRLPQVVIDNYLKKVGEKPLHLTKFAPIDTPPSFIPSPKRA